jgi:putative ABC transport system permease protein
MIAIARPLPAQRFVVFQALVVGPLRDNPGRTALAIVAIALGVALGVAVHLVNASALNEFEVAARHLAGEADLIIRGPRAGFDEALYPKLARLPQVEAANPALDLEVPLVDRPGSLRIIGFDPLQAARVQPSLVPEDYGLLSDLFDADAVLLSATAAEWLGVAAGAEIRVRVGTRPVRLKVIGALPAGVYRQRLGVMDIASAQWRLAQLGRLNRIALRLKPGTDVEAFRRELEALLPAGVQAVTPETEGEHRAALTRAYRLNLDMLALIALFTGAFLVFSSQVLALLRRRSQFALLRAMGLTRVGLAGYLVAEGAAVGIIGAALGLTAGYALARAALLLVGADLGAGYFRSIVADLAVEPGVLAAFFALGVLFAVLGTLGPAWEAAHRAPARALRAGDEEDSVEQMRSPVPGLGAIAAGLLLTLAPAINGLPIAGYAAIALVLFGAVLLMPQLAAALFSRLPVPAGAPSAVAIAQLKATPRRSAISIAAIVISFSFMVSMLIMVSSFRDSLEAWLSRMLPADIYLRAARSGETAFLTPKEQDRIAALPGFARVQFLRVQTVLLTPDRPAMNLLARPIEAAAADKALPLIAPSLVPPANAPPPVWISEVASDLHGLRQGDTLRLPLGGQSILCTVAGVWRDYARQNGAIVIDRDLYIRATGDHLANDAAIWLRKGVDVNEAQKMLRNQLPRDSNVEITATRDVRAASLRIFDRTFAITYALEIAAVVIGLFGVGASFGAQALARRREFGVLRHLGMTRRQIGAMLSQEGAVVAALGVAAGLLVGWAVGLILINVINRQSFHWSMDLHMPWAPLVALAALIIGAAAVTAVWSGRAAMKEDVVRAVREDW